MICLLCGQFVGPLLTTVAHLVIVLLVWLLVVLFDVLNMLNVLGRLLQVR